MKRGYEDKIAQEAKKKPEQEIMHAKEWIIGKMKEGAYLEE